jgi:hypothetical protein
MGRVTKVNIDGLDYRFGGYHDNYQSLEDIWKPARSAELKGLFASRTCKKKLAMFDASIKAVATQSAQREADLAADLVDKKTDFEEAWKILWDLGDEIIAFESGLRDGRKEEVVLHPHGTSNASASTPDGTAASASTSYVRTPSASSMSADLKKKDGETSGYLGSLLLEKLGDAYHGSRHSIEPSSSIRHTAEHFNADWHYPE